MSKIVEIDCCADCPYLTENWVFRDVKYICQKTMETIDKKFIAMEIYDNCTLPNAERREK